ncbi:MAG: SDR family oxidoreductase [Acidimicrobiia bacterium]
MEAPVAVVTGASSGIGASFARVLAARGHELVLVARNESRLADLATELEREHSTKTEVLGADLERDAGVARVAARLGDDARPVELLVNNAGFGTSGPFHTLPVEQERSEIRLNVVALVELTHAALGPMVQRGHGGVINVSSVGAYQPTPLSATYGATKAFVSNFTNAIHEELRGTGVKAMVLAPGFTHTEFHVRAGITSKGMPEFLWQSADEVAEVAMRAYDRGRAVCVPGAINNVAAAFSGSMPAGVSRRVAGLVTKRAY